MMRLRNLVLSLAMILLAAGSSTAARPNILWISCEDIGPHLGCYGYRHATTPHLDQLAADGVRYANAFTVTGVCATCRNSMITCVYPSTLGTQFMRCRVDLPEQIKLFPDYFREAGYYCTNNSKTDYNITGSHQRCWDQSNRAAHWRNREHANQPFFAVFNFTNTHESKVFNYQRPDNLQDDQLHDPDAMQVPPYHPDTEIARTDWAHYYDNITSMDKRAGEILRQLDEDGLTDNTIVVFWSDHGAGLPRCKRWIYESGVHVPLIVRIPGRLRSDTTPPAGSVNQQLVSMIDLPATMMNLAGLAIPSYFDGQPFLGADCPPPREYIFTIRDRMDERYDMIRAVRDQRYKYIRNFQPYKPYFQILNYMEQEHTMQELRRLHAADQLHTEAEQFMADQKPLEELYDLKQDPHEVHNLIDLAQRGNDPQLAQALDRLREQHQQWMLRTRDTGLIPEAELAVRARQLGTRYEILRQPGSDALMKRLIETNRLACTSGSDQRGLLAAAGDPDAAVRYWAITGLGNRGDTSSESQAAITRALNDDSGSVRMAAARAAWQTGRSQEALPVIRAAARSGEEFLTLMAMHLIDEMDQEAAALQPLTQWVYENVEGYPKRVAEYLVRKQ